MNKEKKFDYQMINSVVVVGSGALATFYAAKWGREYEVSVIGTWKESIEAINAGPKIVVGQHLESIIDEGSLIKVKAFTDWDNAKEPDLVVWLTKTYKNKETLEKYKSYNWSCPILILQNGIGQKELFSSILGNNQPLFRGVTSQGAKLIETGVVKNTGDGDVLVEANTLFEDFPVFQVDDIEDIVLRKLAINAVLNPIAALFEVKNGEVLKGKALDKMKELIAVCFPFFEKRNIFSSQEDYLYAVTEVAKRTSENINSMLVDKLSGRRTEVNEILGAMYLELQSKVLLNLITQLS